MIFHSINGKSKILKIDTCVIRTHAPEGIRYRCLIAGERLNHSAKVPFDAH